MATTNIPQAERNVPTTTATVARPATVCQVLHSLNVGGAEVLAERLARQLSPRYRFVFACLDDLGTLGSTLQTDGFRVEVLERRPGCDWRCARRLRNLLASERVDLIHAHQYTPFFYALMSGLVRHRPPVLFTEHGRWFPDYPRRKRMLFNRWFLRRGDRVAAVGQAVRRAVIDNEGIPADRVQVIHNGVDFSAFDAPPADRNALRAELGLQPDDFVWMQVARLDGLKDHGTALRALERAVAVHPNTRLVLVGEGPERTKIETELRQRKLESAVILLGLRNDVPRILPAADGFLLTSVSEGLPLTLIEAMAAELPTVVTRAGGVAEIVIDGETGWQTAVGDDAALAAAMLRLADNLAERRQFGGAGARRARAMFSERKNHEAYVRLYDEMLG